MAEKKKLVARGADCVIPPVGGFTVLDLKLECATTQIKMRRGLETSRGRSLDARDSRRSELQWML